MLRIHCRSLDDLVDSVAGRLAGHPPDRAQLVAMSGIDGSGKTRLSQQLANGLEQRGLRVALIGIDPWQNPQTVRLGGDDPALRFYEQAIRSESLFSELVDPLVAKRSIHLATRGIRTDRDAWYDFEYDYADIDVVLLEGIFLFKRALVPRYDLRIWIECSFETALQRALERNVEDLPADRLVQDYARIYHASQRHHFAVDDPRAVAELLYVND